MSKSKKKSPLAEKLANLVILLCAVSALQLMIRSRNAKQPKTAAPVIQQTTAQKSFQKTVPPAQPTVAQPQVTAQTNFGTLIKLQAAAAVRNLHAELGDPASRE